MIAFELKVQEEKTDLEFSTTFYGRQLFVFVEYLCNRIPKMRTKHFKNYNLILAIVNYGTKVGRMLNPL